MLKLCNSRSIAANGLHNFKSLAFLYFTNIRTDMFSANMKVEIIFLFLVKRTINSMKEKNKLLACLKRFSCAVSRSISKRELNYAILNTTFCTPSASFHPSCAVDFKIFINNFNSSKIRQRFYFFSFSTEH